ncbi:MAG: hypothetical protein P8177_03465 [Gemmatimonadota bacterium]
MPIVLTAGAAGAGLAVWFIWRRSTRVPCTLDLESTHDHLHAHLLLEGIDIDPGDAVSVFDAPDRIEFGERRLVQSEAVVRRASWLRRQWTRLVGRLEFYELYDVGFE